MFSDNVLLFHGRISKSLAKANAVPMLATGALRRLGTCGLTKRFAPASRCEHKLSCCKTAVGGSETTQTAAGCVGHSPSVPGGILLPVDGSPCGFGIVQSSECQTREQTIDQAFCRRASMRTRRPCHPRRLSEQSAFFVSGRPGSHKRSRHAVQTSVSA